MNRWTEAFHGSQAADALAMPVHWYCPAGITANAMVGGDNCHRGAVVGSLPGAICGVPGKFRFKRDCNRPVKA